MSSSTAERLLTAEEFAETTDPPNMRTELVKGRIVTMPPPSTIHGKYVRRIGAALGAFADANGEGDVVVESGYLLEIDPDTVRGPDVSFIAASSLGAGLPPRGYHKGAPTLAIEVISPDEADEQVRGKIDLYLSTGAQRVWEVRPRLRTVTVHRAGVEPHTLTADDLLTSDDAAFNVDGFSLAVRDIFA